MVDERLRSSVLGGIGRELAPDRVVVEKAVAGPDRAWLERPREVAHRAVDVLDEDLGLVTEIAQDFAHERRLIGDGIAVPEVRQELMDRASLTAMRRMRPATLRRAQLQCLLVTVDRLRPVGVVAGIRAASFAHLVELFGGRPLDSRERLGPVAAAHPPPVASTGIRVARQSECTTTALPCSHASITARE